MREQQQQQAQPMREQQQQAPAVREGQQQQAELMWEGQQQQQAQPMYVGGGAAGTAYMREQ